MRDLIKRHQRELDQQVKGQAEVAGLVPFGAAIVALEDSRRRMERLDSEKAAGVLTEVIREIGKSHKAMEASLAKDAKSAPPSSALRTKAADSVRDLRTALRNWHGFYDGYDPMFMWWIGEPYKVADKSLQDYIALLRTKLEEPAAGDTKAAAKVEVKATEAAKAKVPATTPSTKVVAAAPDAKKPESKNAKRAGNRCPRPGGVVGLPQSEFQEVIASTRPDVAALAPLRWDGAPGRHPGQPTDSVGQEVLWHGKLLCAS